MSDVHRERGRQKEGIPRGGADREETLVCLSSFQAAQGLLSGLLELETGVCNLPLKLFKKHISESHQDQGAIE